MDRGAWWSTVHGVRKSWTWLSDKHTHRRHTLIASSWGGGAIVEKRSKLWMKGFVEEKKIKNKSQQASFTKLKPISPKDQENSLIIYLPEQNPSVLNKMKQNWNVVMKVRTVIGIGWRMDHVWKKKKEWTFLW